jgi:hypothetical protein
VDQQLSVPIGVGTPRRLTASRRERRGALQKWAFLLAESVFKPLMPLKFDQPRV